MIPFVERDVPIIADAVVDRALRDRRRQDHPGPRPRRLRDRRAPRPADDRRAGRRRPHHEPGGQYAGLDRYEARQRIVADLEAARATSVASTPHEMLIGRCQRSDDVVEPRLKTQWFVRDGAAGRGGRSRPRATGRTRILPERFEKVWEHWLDRDPRLEREPPALVGPPDPGLVLPGRARHRDRRPGRARPPARPAAGRRRSCVQDPDIFDTWFSSRPVAVLDAGLAGRRRADLARFYPGSVMETGLRHHLLLGRPDDDARAST